MIYKAYFNAPFSTIEISANDFAITHVKFIKNSRKKNPTKKIPEHLKLALKQFNEYFRNKRKCFDLPLLIDGTDFQMKVWMSLIHVNYASTSTYAELAMAIKKPKSYRAVGNAVGSNPFPVIIPCHRVIHSNGDISGFTGGNHIKKWLLKHEGVL